MRSFNTPFPDHSVSRQQRLLSMLSAGASGIEATCAELDDDDARKALSTAARTAAATAVSQVTMLYGVARHTIEPLDDDTDHTDPKRIVILMHCAMIGTAVDLSDLYGADAPGHPAYIATQDAWTTARNLYNVQSTAL